MYVDDGEPGGDEDNRRSGWKTLERQAGESHPPAVFDSSVINGLAGGHGDPRKRRRVEAEEMTSEMRSGRRD